MIIMKSLCMIEHKIQTLLQYGVFGDAANLLI